MNYFFRLISLLFLVLLGLPSSAQRPTGIGGTEVESDSSKIITIIRADNASGERDIESQKLTGEVILRQDSVLIFCDTARLVANNVEAEGQVVIQQNDSTSVFSHRAFYNGDTERGFLYGDTVILNSGNQQLFAKDSLHYDLGNNIVYYSSGAILIQDTTYIVSKKGTYYLDNDEIVFKNEVVVKDTGFLLVTDSLRFNTETRLVTFIAPTRITTDSATIYCEGGQYSLTEEKGYFSQNAQFDNNDQRSTADRIIFDQKSGIVNLRGNAKVQGEDQYASADDIDYNTSTKDLKLVGSAFYREGADVVQGEEINYNQETKVYTTIGRSSIVNGSMVAQAEEFSFDENTGLGYGSGDVVWQDTANGISIVTEDVIYDQDSDYFKAFGDRPLFASDVEGDSLYLSADTLINFSVVTSDTILIPTNAADSSVVRTNSDSTVITIDTSQFLTAFYDVRIFKSDFQGLCDSLVYDQQDSLFYLFKQPIVWSDSSQFVADTIKIQMKNEEIDRIYLIDNAFIINTPDEVLYNQVKGRKITAYFEQSELTKMHVEGNAETVYYAMDEEEQYIGVNKTVSSEMLLFFERNEIVRIKFLSPDANMYPIESTNHESLKINGFKWRRDDRPKAVVDL